MPILIPSPHTPFRLQSFALLLALFSPRQRTGCRCLRHDADCRLLLAGDYAATDDSHFAIFGFRRCHFSPRHCRHAIIYFHFLHFGFIAVFRQKLFQIEPLRFSCRYDDISFFQAAIAEAAYADY